MSPPYRWSYRMFRDITLSKLTANELSVLTSISYTYDGGQQIKHGDAKFSYTYIIKVQVIFMLQIYARRQSFCVSVTKLLTLVINIIGIFTTYCLFPDTEHPRENMASVV